MSSLSVGVVVAVVVAVAGFVIGLHLAPESPPPLRAYTTRELRSAAAAQRPLLLVVIGEVYDVSSGREHYSRGGGYDFFANGFDGSRAFLTGDSANATDDLDDLRPGECMGIEHWAGFYAKHENYTRVGTHAGGRFYDLQLEPTDALRRLRECVARGHVARAAALAAVLAAPACATTVPDRGEEKRFRTGKWARHACEPPRVPRWQREPDPAGGTNLADRCACLRPGEPAEGGWDPAELAMTDDIQMALPYPACGAEPEDSSCVVRTL